MVVVVAPEAVDATIASLEAGGTPASVIGEVVPAERLDGARYVEARWRRERPDRGRRVGGRIQPPGAPRGRRTRRARRRDRPRLRRPTCPALDWAAEQGIETDRRARTATDAALAARRSAPPRRTSSCSPATCGSSARGPRGLRRPDPQHAPVAPARVPGRSRRARRARARASRSRERRSTSSTRRSTAARSSPRRRSRSSPATTRSALHDRIRAVEHRLLPRAVALLLAGACRSNGPVVDPVDLALGRCRRPGRPAGPAVRLGQDRARRARTGPRRCPASSSSRPAAPPARCARPACPSRTWPRSPASRRCSTAGSRRSIRASTAASWPIGASPEHRQALLAAAIAPVRARRRQPLPVRRRRRATWNHVRRARRGDRHRRPVDGPGGGEEPRVGRDRHVAGSIPGGPRRPGEEGSVPAGLRAALALEAFRHTAAYDARIAAELPRRMVEAGSSCRTSPGLPSAADPVPV